LRVSDKSSSDAPSQEDAEATTQAVPYAISVDGGEWIEVPEHGLLLGRSKGCDVILEDEDASRRHALLRTLGGALWVVDEGSTNGTLLDGETITRKRVAEGDVLVIGNSRVRVERRDAEWPRALREDWERFRTAARARSLDAVEALRILAAAEDCRAGSDGAVAINWAEGERGMDGLGPMRMRLVQNALGILAGVED
jgi:FHA domain